MSYVNKTWIQAQFKNFSDKITVVFAKKTDIPKSLPASNTTSDYSATDTAPVNGVAVNKALQTQQAAIDATYQKATEYTDQIINETIGALGSNFIGGTVNEVLVERSTYGGINITDSSDTHTRVTGTILTLAKQKYTYPNGNVADNPISGGLRLNKNGGTSDNVPTMELFGEFARAALASSFGAFLSVDPVNSNREAYGVMQRYGSDGSSSGAILTTTSSDMYIGPELSGNVVRFVSQSNDTKYVATYASRHNTSSSIRFKENILDMTEEIAMELLKLRPVVYDYKKEYGGAKDQEGLIAEEVDKIAKYHVSYDQNGNPEGLDYSSFVPKLIKMVQIQQEQINNLQQEVEMLKNR